MDVVGGQTYYLGLRSIELGRPEFALRRWYEDEPIAKGFWTTNWKPNEIPVRQFIDECRHIVPTEEAGRREPRAGLTPDDIAALRGKPDAAVRAALEMARTFQGARVIQ